MSVIIGFVINPIAGMGGRVGLKGTDGVYDEAVNRGAVPVAAQKATLALESFLAERDHQQVEWLSCADKMGASVLASVGIESQIVYEPGKDRSSAEDTQLACEHFLDHNVDLIVFCGGDGTARDIATVVEKKVPLLGIPSGVKMHSGVFGVNPAAAGKMIHRFLSETVSVGEVEIMDLDETLYRQGTWKVRLFHTVKGIIEPTFVQVGKMSFATVPDEEVKDDIAEHIKEEISDHPNVLYLFGSGGTIDHIARYIGFDNTVLGIDAICHQEVVEKDVNEQQLLSLVSSYDQVKVILSPIGAQGFILGRGNLQLSPTVIKKIGVDNIIVVSTPSKLQATPVLRVDTGDTSLDASFAALEMIMVVIGYRVSRVVKIQQS
ncbi:MAG: ATP-NAD kinase family protein [Thermoplasmatota archaeon]